MSAGMRGEDFPNRYVTPSVVCVTILVMAASGCLAANRWMKIRTWKGVVASALVVVALMLFGTLLAFALWGGRRDGSDNRLLPFKLWGTSARPVYAAALGLLAVAAIVLVQSGVRRGGLIPLAALAVLVASSAHGGRVWVDSGGLHTYNDKTMTEYALALRDMTDQHAVLAVTWAGGLPYYSDRPAVDILGKSDRVVASAAPRGPFRPGHNKWDYEHSIRDLRPDVVAQLWRATPDDLALLKNVGYRLTCLRSGHILWVRTDSQHIRWVVLHSSSRPCTPADRFAALNPLTN
jgi:hypothetical protein